MIKELVNKAYNFAQEKHKDQVRKFSGLPYFSHPKYVARIVEQFTNNSVMVAAALLHDVVEDTNTTIEEIEGQFGKEVSELVNQLTSSKKSKESKKLYLANKMVNMSSDALLIKLVDRYHNILFLENDKVPASFISKYCKETAYIISYTARNRKEHLSKQHQVLMSTIMEIVSLFQTRLKF